MVAQFSSQAFPVNDGQALLNGGKTDSTALSRLQNQPKKFSSQQKQTRSHFNTDRHPLSLLGDNLTKEDMGKNSKKAIGKTTSSDSTDGVAMPKSKVVVDENDEEQAIQDEHGGTVAIQEQPPKKDVDSDSEDEEEEDSDEEEDDDLILEGVIVRNPEVSDSDDTSTSSEESDEEVDGGDGGDDDDDSANGDEKPSKKRPSPTSLSADGDKNQMSSKRKKIPDGQSMSITSSKQSQRSNASKVDSNETQQQQQKNKKKKSRNKQEERTPEIVQVEFTFCDMNEKFFHGLKTLLTSSSPIYASNSSVLSDLMIKNIAVGTVVSTEGDTEGTVFGFASVLNISTYQNEQCIQSMKRLCLDKCPAERKAELEVVLSGTTRRPAGFFLQGRMVNMPLEVVEVMHQQLLLDIDWAVEHAEGGPDERKSLDFGAFVRIAPTYRLAGSNEKGYKYFEDEIMESHAEFSYDIELPKHDGADETPHCSVIVMTKTGHRAAMKEVKQMVHGS